MRRVRYSTLIAAALVAVAVLLLGLVIVLDRSDESTGRTVVTVRLWDQQVAAAYRESFDEFSRRHPDVEVRTNVVAYATYFDSLRTDVAGGGADDIFWISNAYFAGYADNGKLLDVRKLLGTDMSAGWEPSVIEQFTRSGVLWGVPQLTDAGIALYYNADLLAAAGVEPALLTGLRWGPDPKDDTLRPLLMRLTRDRQWAYNAANDLQGIYLNYIGSAGGKFQDGDRFAFDNPGAVEAFRYLVRLINDDKVAPPASDTNDNGDFSRNQFLQGKMALFQSGTYNLAQIAAQAPFRWGIAMMPAGPTGRISVTNGIAAAGNSATRHPDAVREVLAWMGGEEGNRYVGARGGAIPAVLAAQRPYFDYWRNKGIDVTPFFTVLNGPRIPAPGGPGFAAGYQAFKPYFDEMFLGRLDVSEALGQAQAAANAAATR
jgi:multiple sugar transport system substrate-binding protein